jgi:hypothetical protein
MSVLCHEQTLVAIFDCSVDIDLYVFQGLLTFVDLEG